MSLALRAPLLNQHIIAHRSLHTTRGVLSAPGHYHHLPFNFPGAKKGAFAGKLFVFLAAGFSIPMAATVYQLKKASA